MRNEKGQFIKGLTPWNKNKKGLQKPTSGCIKKGQRLSPKTEFKKGKKPHNWKGGIRELMGYIYIFSPDHPFCNKQKLVAEHRLVMEKQIGRYLDKKEVIHHIDGDRKNNKISNLILFPNHSAHHKFRHINEINFICKFCGRNQKNA